ncbi:hypothetical protein MASR2M48_34130 [Spirochaetota bacterium]
MAYIRTVATEVHPGEYDTLAILIGEERDMVFAFNGFMGSIDGFDGFLPEEMIIYKGKKAKEVFESVSSGKFDEDDSNTRNIAITDEIKKRIVDWMFYCDHLVLM